MKDQFSRKINYLRISVTDRCNLSCQYCKLYPFSFRDSSSILSYEEILRVVKISLTLGINKFRLTGGEPLIRKDLAKFVRKVNSLKGIEDLSLTTNGILLKKYAKSLKEAGLKRINLSLDTLKEDKFKLLCRKDALKDVLSGIKEALKIGFVPLKINLVVLRDFNLDEIDDFINFTKDFRVIVRFIELMPFNEELNWFKRQFVSVKELKEKLRRKYILTEVKDIYTAGPAKYYKIKDFGIIGFIAGVNECFCQDCNRLRLTSYGSLRPCLWNKNELNLKEMLRAYAGDQEIIQKIKDLVICKPKERKLTQSQVSMWEVGG
ncbi:MAG: GTP 3',8-cyclase MoaA [Armatimonadetes bacterium]|nr:GTP 3',8-cyclase MoaA [Armatimonadota bacterium]